MIKDGKEVSIFNGRRGLFTSGYELYEIGVVQEGERKVIFEPERITLPPPGQ
ncbi:MAG: hypothetical protein V1770_05360 [bacterium]